MFLLTTPERYPLRPGIVEEREAEHIYHLTHKERCIAIAERYHIGYVIRRGCCEHQTIKHRIDHIADGTRKYQGYEDDVEQTMRTPPDDAIEIDDESDDGYRAQQLSQNLPINDMPHAIPLFSMKSIKNQSVTRTDSPSKVVLMYSLIHWSMISSTTTIAVTSQPICKFLFFSIYYFFLASLEATLNVA